MIPQGQKMSKFVYWKLAEQNLDLNKEVTHLLWARELGITITILTWQKYQGIIYSCTLTPPNYGVSNIR